MNRVYNQTIRVGWIGWVLLITSPGTQAFDGEIPGMSNQDSLLQKADTFEKTGQYLDALGIYEDLLRDGTGRGSPWTAYVLFRQGCVQYQSGDKASAIESVNAAMALDPTEPSYKAFLSEMTGDGTSESKRSNRYRAHRNEGSAKQLLATNGILHIFVRGRNTIPWDSQGQEQIQQCIENADRWLEGRAAESGHVSQPQFVHRYLTVPDEPFWRRIDVPEPDSTSDYRRDWLKAILVRFQAGSYAELFDRVFEGAHLDNRSVVFHTANRDFSFSSWVPYKKMPTDLESVFVSSEISEWINPFNEVVYTHELLHLYGADDLFNKIEDPTVPKTELMGDGAHSLEECELCQWTRYAIGWVTMPPHSTHLHLMEAGSKRNLKAQKGA